MFGVINLLRRQLYVFLHVWGTLFFQVREYEEREKHFRQADEGINGIGRGWRETGRGEKESFPCLFSPTESLVGSLFSAHSWRSLGSSLTRKQDIRRHKVVCGGGEGVVIYETRRRECFIKYPNTLHVDIVTNARL